MAKTSKITDAINLLLLCGRPIGCIMSCLSIWQPICPIPARNSKTKKCRKIKIGITKGTSKRTVNFQLKRSRSLDVKNLKKLPHKWQIKSPQLRHWVQIRPKLTIVRPNLRRTRHCLHLRCYRGRRAGRRRRPSPTLLIVANGASVIVSNRHAVCSVPRAVVRRPHSLLHVHVDRHSTPTGRELVFGCLNIRSIANKLDDLLEVRRDFTIDVLFLVETWHDTESVSLRRLRADGFQVVDRSRPQGSISVLLQVISWYHCPEFLWSSSLLSEAYITTVTTIRLRYDDTMTHSTTTEVIEIMICVRFDCDMTTTQLRWKNDMFIFCSRRIALNVSRCVRYVVVGS